MLNYIRDLDTFTCIQKSLYMFSSTLADTISFKAERKTLGDDYGVNFLVEHILLVLLDAHGWGLFI